MFFVFITSSSEMQVYCTKIKWERKLLLEILDSIHKNGEF